MIEVEGLTKLYGSTVAVKDLSFRVEPGEILGLVGPNGAGKTTTLLGICGILPPTAGRIRVGGHDIALEPVRAKRELAFVPDEPHLFDYLTVREHLRFVARLFGVEDAEARIPPLLESLELIDKAEGLPATLSRGMKQKLAFGCALIHDPKALLFDEPLTGLDPAAIRKAKGVIRDRAKAGAAVIVSSHLLALVEEIADRVLIIQNGRKVAHAALAELKASLPELGVDADLEEIFLTVTGRENGSPANGEKEDGA